MKSNWKFKRKINITVSELAQYRRLVKAISYLTYLARFIMRGFTAFGKDDKSGIHVNSTRKYAYLSTPKVGTSTIVKHLRKTDQQDMVQYKAKFADLLAEGKVDDSYYCFVFSRNPWARIYSCWFDKISTEKRFCDFFIITRYKGLYPNMPFEDFVDWLLSEEGSDTFADRHWISQHELIGDDAAIQKVNKIGKLENFSEDFQSILENLEGVDKSVERANSLSNSADSYKSKYNEQTREKVASRYKKDIELFQYEF